MADRAAPAAAAAEKPAKAKKSPAAAASAKKSVKTPAEKPAGKEKKRAPNVKKRAPRAERTAKTDETQTDAAFVYMLRCADGTLYTGWTNDLEKRVKAHNDGRGAKYTHARRPVTLVYSETLPTKEAALRREAAVKKLTRAQKLALIAAKND